MRRFTLLALLAACGDDLTPPIDMPPDTSGRAIAGHHVVRYRHLDGTVVEQEQIDLWDTVVEAHAPDGDVIPGNGHRDGTFSIDGVPDGAVWLRVAPRPAGDSFYWGSAASVSFDEDVLGARIPASAGDGDQLRFEVDGLEAWQDTDALAWFVPDDDVFDQSVLSPSPPAAGTTNLIGASVDWTGRSLADIDAGDPAFLVQYRQQTINGVDMIAPIRAAHPTLKQHAGTSATITTTLTAPDVLSYHLAWARDAFEAQRTAIHPTRAGASYSHGLSLVAIGGLVDGEVWVGVEYPLATLADPSILEDTTPLDLGELAIPNPFPRAWVTDFHVVSFPVDLPMPDGTPVSLEAAIGMRRTDFSAPATPVLTPVRAPTIAGRDGFSDTDGVGLRPEIAWQAPAIGAPTSYQLTIIEAVPNPPFPFRPGWYITAELWVPGDVTKIQVPTDVLKPGTTYAIRARAIAQPGQDVGARPFRQGADAAFADAFLGRFTP